MARESRLVAAFGLLQQLDGFVSPAIDSAEDAGQDDGRRERLRMVRALRPPAATAKLVRVVGEHAEFSGGGIVVPPGDRVVGLVAEPPWMALVQQGVVRESGVATVAFGQGPGGFAVIAGQPLAPAKDAARGEHRRMAGIAVESQ